jgi:membrane protease YdiL (CAAX protease family)
VSRGRPPRPLLLLLGSAGLVLLTILSAPVLGRALSSLAAVLSLAALYWTGCWLLALLGAPRRELATLYRDPLNRRPFELALTWVPPAVTFALVFVAAAPRLSARWMVAVVLVAVVNGATEELLWRGAFVATFPASIRLAYLVPAALFAAWHIALALLPGVRYNGGTAGLLGGAAAAGLVWGLAVLRTREMRSVTIAHVLTNVFAFPGLVVSNWSTGS